MTSLIAEVGGPSVFAERTSASISGNERSERDRSVLTGWSRAVTSSVVAGDWGVPRRARQEDMM